MLKIKLNWGLCGAVLLLAGCSTTASTSPETAKLTEFSAEADQTLRQQAERYAEGMCEALKSGEFAALKKQLPPQTAKRLTAEKFSRMRKNMLKNVGQVVSFHYVTTLNHTRFKDYVWKVTYVFDSGLKHEGWYFIRGAIINGKPELVGAGFSFLTHPKFLRQP